MIQAPMISRSFGKEPTSFQRRHQQQPYHLAPSPKVIIDSIAFCFSIKTRALFLSVVQFNSGVKPNSLSYASLHKQVHKACFDEESVQAFTHSTNPLVDRSLLRLRQHMCEMSVSYVKYIFIYYFFIPFLEIFEEKSMLV